MAQYRVQATFEITVTAEYMMEDAAEATAVEASEEEQERLLQRTEDRTAELAENLLLTMHGCDAWELHEVAYQVERIEAVE